MNNRNLLRSGIAVGAFTVLSRIFGLGRELFMAWFFGVSTETDMVNVAFRLPNLFRRIFGEGALAASFIPLYKKSTSVNPKDARIFASQVIFLLMCSVWGIIILMQVFIDPLMFVLAPGFAKDPETIGVASDLCRITIFYLFFICTSAFFGAILNSIGKYWFFAFVPALLSISIILFTYFGSSYVEKSLAFAIAVNIAGILQLGFMYFAVSIAGVRPKIRLYKFQNLSTATKTFIKNMIPASTSGITAQLNLFVSQSISSFIPGAISVLSYAERLYQFPLAVIGVSFSTVLLPSLSSLKSAKDKNINLVNNSIKLAFSLTVPTMIGIIMLSEYMVNLIYLRGAFTQSHAILTAKVLSAFALGLPAYIMIKILNQVFYAMLDTKTPLKISLCSILVNASLNIILMQFFAHTGIALGTTIAAWVQVYLILYFLNKNFSINPHMLSGWFILKLTWACSGMAVFIYTAKIYLTGYYWHAETITKTALLLVTILIAASIFFALSFLLGIHKHIKR